MGFLTIDDLEVANKRVLVRADFNVPLNDKGEVANDKRIRATIPTIKAILDRGARQVVLMSHLGDPKGKPDPKLRMDPVAKRLRELLGAEVAKADDCIDVKLPPARVVLLENLRFHPGEEANDPAFAAKLASLGDVYLNDAFGTCHRAHASMEAVARLLPAAAGLLVQRELEMMGRALASPKRPFVAIMGGAKVSDKIKVISNLLPKVDKLLIGGAMMFTFLRAQGKGTGRSLVEEDRVELARGLLKDPKLVLPVDAVVADALDEKAPSKTVGVDAIAEGSVGLDIGPRTQKLYAGIIAGAGTVVWNGPMGKFEWKRYAEGTRAVATAVAKSKATSIIGGGDSAAAIEDMGLADKVTHVSTGGGASINFLEGKTLPAIAALEDSYKKSCTC